MPLVPIAKADDRQLIRQHGLRGAPKGVDRETRQAIWEARARHLNRKRNRWDKTGKVAGGLETAGGVAAGTAGAAVAAHQLRESMSPEGRTKFNAGVDRRAIHAMDKFPKHADAIGRVAGNIRQGKPGFKLLATGAVGAGTAVAARRARIIANKKKRKYSTASGGIASGTARRMQDYSVSKSEPGQAMRAYERELIAKAAETKPKDPLKRRKQAQGVLTTSAATLGLATLGSKAGASILPKIATSAKLQPKAAAYARHLDRAADHLVYGAAGVGGASGLHQGALYRAESKQKEPKAPKKGKLMKAYGRSAAVDAARWGTGLTAASGAGGGSVYAHERRQEKPKSQARRDATGAVVGGLGGQSVYQAAGYEAKHYSLRNHTNQVSRSARDKRLKPAKKAYGSFTPQMERNYPNSLPEWRVHRALGYTHRGKTGTAIGAAATVAGAGAGLAIARKHKVEKADRYRDKLGRFASTTHSAIVAPRGRVRNFDPDKRTERRQKRIEGALFAGSVVSAGVAATGQPNYRQMRARRADAQAYSESQAKESVSRYRASAEAKLRAQKAHNAARNFKGVVRYQHSDRAFENMSQAMRQAQLGHAAAGRSQSAYKSSLKIKPKRGRFVALSAGLAAGGLAYEHHRHNGGRKIGDWYT